MLQVQRLKIAALFASLALGCSDATRPSRNADGVGILPLAVSASSVEADAYAISAYYLSTDPLQTLSVSYDAFNEDPECISDSAFAAQGEVLISEGGVPLIESNEEVVFAWAGGGGGGGGGGDEEMMSMSSAGACEQKYASLVSRCRRLPIAKARALCYAAAMATYAACRALM